jgi:hypothetical protein
LIAAQIVGVLISDWIFIFIMPAMARRTRSTGQLKKESRFLGPAQL